MATIEIDGKKIEVESGQMVIEAADEAGIPIPRFCYHKKLSVAANCRMCLVEVEKSAKPLPACATPVTDGMKVYTKSPLAIKAQQAVMEFLLINHPLDCPICDQGGECELQDVSMGYGDDVSFMTEGKRAVEDDNLGSLIATEMTRCIHCTRCVRFGEEIAGIRELGGTGRGEHMQIGTYIEHSMTSEVSGNVIDLCPVGALTSRPYRFTARAWELSQHESVSPHDCLGSNLYLHVRRNRLMRVVPKENESINETWLSDRDRFAYTGLHAEDRLTQPMVKKDGLWREVSWDEALETAVRQLKRMIDKHGADQVAGLCSSQATTEEAFLMQKWLRALGVNHLDHRLHQTDFEDQYNLPVAPVATSSIESIEKADAIFVIGSNVQREQPLLGLRVRKAALSGAKVVSLNAVDYDWHFEQAASSIVSPEDFVFELATIVSECVTKKTLPTKAKNLLVGLKAEKNAKAIAKVLKEAKDITVILGSVSLNHPNASTIRSLVHLLETCPNVTVFRMTEGPNEAGCHYAGMLPHRGPFGEMTEAGLTHREVFDVPRKAYVLHQFDPDFDITNPFRVRQALLGAEFVMMFTSVKTDSMMEYADVLLPTASFGETSGTYVNVSGEWQSFKGAIKPEGDARPAWKIFRVLGNLFDLSGFDYNSSVDVLNDLQVAKELSTPSENEWYSPPPLEHIKTGLMRIGEWPLYRIDNLCRRAKPLQNSAANDKPVVRLHSKTAKKLKLKEMATISQGKIEITLPLVCDDKIAEGAVYIANAWAETSDLGDAFAPIKVK